MAPALSGARDFPWERHGVEIVPYHGAWFAAPVQAGQQARPATSVDEGLDLPWRHPGDQYALIKS